MLLQRRGDRVGETLAVDGEGRAGGHPGRVGGAHDERSEPTHLLLQQPDRVIELVAAERVAADELCELVRLVHGSRPQRAHLVQRHGYTSRRDLPRGFGAGEAAADDSHTHQWTVLDDADFRTSRGFAASVLPAVPFPTAAFPIVLPIVFAAAAFALVALAAATFAADSFATGTFGACGFTASGFGAGTFVACGFALIGTGSAATPRAGRRRADRPPRRSRGGAPRRASISARASSSDSVAGAPPPPTHPLVSPAAAYPP